MLLLHVGRRVQWLWRLSAWGVEFGVHLLTQLVDELTRIQRFTQRLVVLDTAFLEVDRQILGWVAPLVGTCQPDFLRPLRRQV